MKLLFAELMALLGLGGGLWWWLHEPDPAPMIAVVPPPASTGEAFSSFVWDWVPAAAGVALIAILLSLPIALFLFLRSRHEVQLIRAQRQAPEHVESYSPRLTYAPNYSQRWPAGSLAAPMITDVSPSPPLPLAAWFPSVVQHDGHILILGDTGSGKSTIARALLADRGRTDKIVVLDPHANLNDWCGVPTVGDGRDFDAIEGRIMSLHAEFERRFQPGEDIGPGITVFIDEFPAIAGAKKDTVKLIMQWLREARKTGFRVVVLSTGWEVDSLGIQGQGSIRENFITLRLGAFAIEELPDAESQPYPAVLVRGNRKGAPRLIDTTGVPGLMQETVPPELGWQPDPLLEMTTTTHRLEHDTQEEDRRRCHIVALAEQGMKPTPIAEEVFGYSNTRTVRLVKEVLDQEGRR